MVWAISSATSRIALPAFSITTIGYGDYTPTGSIMQLYTIVYAALGIGLFVAFSARLVQFAIQSRQEKGTASADNA